jgi:carbon storage regulator
MSCASTWTASGFGTARRHASPNKIILGRDDLPHRAKEWVMLVLSRKKNESIVINNDITIVVVEIRGDKVRLGVEAPKEVPVHRREVYDAIKRNEASQPEDSAGEKGISEATGE